MNAKLVPHLGHVVTVTGNVVTKEGKSAITSDSLILSWNEDS
jgi:lipopolysaccharide export system protein LptA